MMNTLMKLKGVAVSVVIFTLHCLIIYSPQAAEVFKYKDANGKWHYTDK